MFWQDLVLQRSGKIDKDEVNFMIGYIKQFAGAEIIRRLIWSAAVMAITYLTLG